MGDLIKLLADYLPEFSARHADALRLAAASFAAFNALHLSGAISWLWQFITRFCRWCKRLTAWVRGA